MKILNGNDEILLLTILSLKENAYGATIMQRLSDMTHRDWSIGAVYDPLHRLEKSGYVRSELTMPTPERGGRSKRVYKVTSSGLDALRQHQSVRNKISRQVDDLIWDSNRK